MVGAALLLGWELRASVWWAADRCVPRAGCQCAGGVSGSLEDTLAQSGLGFVPETAHLPSSALLVPGTLLGAGHAVVSCRHASTESDCHTTRQGPQVWSGSIGEPSCGQMSSLMPKEWEGVSRP